MTLAGSRAAAERPGAARARAPADVLVVEDRASLRTMLRRTLEARGYSVSEAADVAEARAALARSRIAVVLTDLRLPRGSGMDVLVAAREADPTMPVVVMTAYGTVEDAVAAMKEGAFDFLPKPVDTDHLLVLVERAIEQRRLRTENLILKEEYAARYGFPEIVGEHPSLKRVGQALQRAAQAETTVLLEGESGTGKELFARALHHLSPRRDGPFLALNCAAIPETLLENELFGHEKGAFTGATTRKLGKLELASGGTVLLDEIGDMPLGLQAKLLRVIEERAFERVGGTHPVRVDVRIVAATNRDLRRAVAEKAFREDLYFRLAAFPITIPPLRERREDIPRLVVHFVERFCREMGKRPLRVSAEAMDRLVAYDWPGNVRELTNALERAVILCDGEEIGAELLGVGAARSWQAPPSGLDFSGTLAEVARRAVAAAEREKIRRVLAEVGGDRRRAAERLGVSARTLAAKLRDYELGGEARNGCGDAVDKTPTALEAEPSEGGRQSW